MCRIVQFLLYVTCYVTVYTLIAVSAVRYLTVVYGPHAAFIKTKRNVLLAHIRNMARLSSCQNPCVGCTRSLS